MSGIDWNVELRKIEREFDGLPPQASPRERRAQLAAERRERKRRSERHAVLGGWGRLALVATLAGSLYWWPYLRTCGPGLLAYLGAEVTVVAGAIWVGTFTWRHRTGTVHVLAMVMMVTGLALAAAEILPRIGYSRPDPSRSPQWWCDR